MKYLKLFEEYDIELIPHLKERGIDPDKTKVLIDEESGNSYFFLYNLSGQIIGYQKYNPNLQKKSNPTDPKMAKYFTWVSDEGLGKYLAAWGLESVDFIKDKYLFITEGIFDAARIQEAGYPAISVLGNDPSKDLLNWLFTLSQKRIVIYDNDKAGRKLKKAGDFSFCVPSGKDANDLTPEEAKVFLNKCLVKCGLS